MLAMCATTATVSLLPLFQLLVCQIVGKWWSNLWLFMLFLMSGLPLCDEPPFASDGNNFDDPLYEEFCKNSERYH
jgi:hypothetical protein